VQKLIASTRKVPISLPAAFPCFSYLLCPSLWCLLVPSMIQLNLVTVEKRNPSAGLVK